MTFLNILIGLLLTVHVLVSVLIVFVTLMQRPKSEGLGAAFGGGVTENFFGAQTTNVLANFTRWMAGIFFGLTLVLSVLYAKQSSRTQKSAIHEQLAREPKPPAAPAGTPVGKPALDAKPVTPVEAPKPSAVKPELPAPVNSDAKSAPAPATPANPPPASK